MGKWTERYKVEVLYDGSCPLCIRIVRLLKRFDWFHMLQFTSFREISETSLPVPLSQLEKRIHCVHPFIVAIMVTAQGRLWGGSV
ncbi:MAG: DUF393 domain-containing protein [Alicyclobacillaceae bacterium]|nr:DUF393 domain-containing protein [Alicyclobacillaceae bacterium]